MTERRLRLVISNPHITSTEVPWPSARVLSPVPDSDLEICRLVKKFSEFLLEDHDSGPIRYLEQRRKYDTASVIGAIQCLSPKAVDRLRADLMIIAELTLYPPIRHAALRKLTEAEFSQ